jgi:hypothetical protein
VEYFAIFCAREGHVTITFGALFNCSWLVSIRTPVDGFFGNRLDGFLLDSPDDMPMFLSAYVSHRRGNHCVHCSLENGRIRLKSMPI